MKFARTIFILALVFSAFMIEGCFLEGDETTSFKGVVLYTGTEEPYTAGQIEIIGSDSEKVDAYRKKFPIESDESFNIQVSTSDIGLFQIQLVPNDGSLISPYCSGATISEYCTLMSAGKNHNDITIMVQIPNSN